MTSRSVVSPSITAKVAVVAGVAAWWLGHTLGLEAGSWLSGGVFVIACLGGIAATEPAGRARRADGISSRFVSGDTTGITIGGLSIEECPAREGRERKQDGDADARR